MERWYGPLSRDEEMPDKGTLCWPIVWHSGHNLLLPPEHVLLC